MSANMPGQSGAESLLQNARLSCHERQLPLGTEGDFCWNGSGAVSQASISPWPPPGLCGWGPAAAFLSIKRGTHSHSCWAGGLMSAASSTDPGGTASPGPGFSICDTGAGAHLTWRLLGIPQKLSLPKLGTTPWQQ